MTDVIWLRPLTRYADFRGRSGRPEYWLYMLAYLIVECAILLLAMAFEQLSNALLVILVVGTFIPNLAVSVRRMHDTGRSGWLLLISCIPLIGAIFVLVWLCSKGDAGLNRFGPPDGAQAPQWEAPAVSCSGALERLEQLAALHSAGALSAEEFAQLKSDFTPPTSRAETSNVVGRPTSLVEVASTGETSYDAYDYFADEPKTSRKVWLVGGGVTALVAAGALTFFVKPWQLMAPQQAPAPPTATTTAPVQPAALSQPEPPLISLTGLTYDEFRTALSRYPELNSRFNPATRFPGPEGQQVLEQLSMGPQSRGRVVSLGGRTLLVFESCKTSECRDNHAYVALDPQSGVMHAAVWRDGALAPLLFDRAIASVLDARCAKAGPCSLDGEFPPSVPVAEAATHVSSDETTEDGTSPQSAQPAVADGSAAGPAVVAPVALGSLAAIVSSDDYPASALAANAQGRVGFRAVVDQGGRVQSCAVTFSSGSAALDAATCRIVQQRARFRPATDAQGMATLGSYSSSIFWRL